MVPTPFEHIRAALAPAAAQGQLYALIDLACAPEGLHHVTGQRAPAGAWCLFENGIDDNAAAAAPWLWALPHAPASAELDRSIELGLLYPAVTWLASPLGAATLRQRLARRLDVVLPGNIELLLRYFDPRILSALGPLLTPEQAGAFFALGNAWWALDPAGQLHRQPLSAPPVDALQAALPIQAPQEAALIALSECNHLHADLHRAAPAAWRELPPETRWPWVQRQHAAAAQWRLQSFDDKLRLCLLALREGEAFAQRDPWPRLMPAVAAGEISLRQAFEQATEAA